MQNTYVRLYISTIRNTTTISHNCWTHNPFQCAHTHGQHICMYTTLAIFAALPLAPPVWFSQKQSSHIICSHRLRLAHYIRSYRFYVRVCATAATHSRYHKIRARRHNKIVAHNPPKIHKRTHELATNASFSTHAHLNNTLHI